MDEKVDDDLLDKGPHLGEWYSGQGFYGFKSMVSEESSAMRCAAEIADLMTEISIKPHPVCTCTLTVNLRAKLTIYLYKNRISPYFLSATLKKC